MASLHLREHYQQPEEDIQTKVQNKRTLLP